MIKRNLILIVLVLLSACTGLGGEPAIVATIPAATPRPTEAPHPLTMPDIARGAAIFAQNCTSCHGVNGNGAGSLVASGQVPEMASFRSPDTAADQRPLVWFETITNGRIEQLMPPWADALSSEDRWSVAYYTYTLHYETEEIARGREVYALHCQECHGDRGAGDGPRAAELSGSTGDLSSLPNMALISDRVIYTSINEGIGDPDDGMPAFAGILSEAEMWDAVAYARSLTLENSAAIGTAPQPTLIAQAPTTDASIDLPATITINGVVTNGSATGSVPPNLALRLFTFDELFNQAQVDTQTDETGAFTFADVALDASGAYVVTAEYRGRVFTSALVRGSQLADDAVDSVVDLPLTIYELTEDPDVIQITGIATQVNVIGDGMEIAQVFNIRNTSDRAFSSSQTTSDGRAISLVFALPPGALVMGFGDNQQRFVTSEDNGLVFDTIPVLPGEDHVVQVIYLVPYGGGAIIEQPLTYALAGALRLLVSPTTLTVTGDLFAPLGEQTIGAQAYAAYGGAVNLQSGAVLRYEIGGAGIDAGQVGDRAAPVVSSSNLLIIIGIVLITAAFVGGALIIIAARNQQTRRPAPDQSEIDALAAQIAELDALLDAGEITPEVHERRRSALRARMAALLQDRQA